MDNSSTPNFSSSWLGNKKLKQFAEVQLVLGKKIYFLWPFQSHTYSYCLFNWNEMLFSFLFLQSLMCPAESWSLVGLWFLAPPMIFLFRLSSSKGLVLFGHTMVMQCPSRCNVSGEGAAWTIVLLGRFMLWWSLACSTAVIHMIQRHSISAFYQKSEKLPTGNLDFRKSCISSYGDKDIFPDQHKSWLFSCWQTSQPCLLNRERGAHPPVFWCSYSPRAVRNMVEGNRK